MKKTLIISTMVLAIVTSIVAGTLAVYTKTLDFDGQVTAKTFDIRETANETIDIKLAPSEVDSWNFTLTNTTDAGLITEVDMSTDIAVTMPAEFADVSIKLYTVAQDGTKTLVNVTSTTGNTTLYSNADFSKAGVSTTVNYELEFTWNNNTANNAAHTDLGLESVTKPVSVSITGTQVIA